MGFKLASVLLKCPCERKEYMHENMINEGANHYLISAIEVSCHAWSSWIDIFHFQVQIKREVFLAEPDIFRFWGADANINIRQ